MFEPQHASLILYSSVQTHTYHPPSVCPTCSWESVEVGVCCPTQSRLHCGLGQVWTRHSPPFMCRKTLDGANCPLNRPLRECAPSLVETWVVKMQRRWVHLRGITALSNALWCGLYFISWTLSRAGSDMSLHSQRGRNNARLIRGSTYTW